MDLDDRLFRQAFDACPAPLILFDRDWNPIAMSRGAQDLLRFDLEALRDRWREPCTRRSGADGDRLEGSCHCTSMFKTGDRNTTIGIDCSTIRNSDGRVVGGIAVLRRILRRIEPSAEGDEEAASSSPAEVKERPVGDPPAPDSDGSRSAPAHAEALARLAGGIAHNFNNALAGLIGVASLAKMEHMDDEDLVRDLDDILRQARRMAEWVRRLLAYARHAPFAPVVCDPGAVIEDAVRIIRPGVPLSFRIIVEKTEGLPRIRADISQIQQMCEELISNAVEASGGRGQIRIRAAAAAPEIRDLEKEREGSAWVCLSFEDSGPGMDEDTIRNLFSPFFSTRVTGRGMGLAVVQSIVHQHGGRITVRSQPGVGTRFDVFLPAVAADEAVEWEVSPGEVSGETARKKSFPEPTLGPVLLIDDEAVVAEMFRQFLLREGVDVLVAASGEEAVKTAGEATSQIRLVLMDMVLPGLSGTDLLQALRNAGVDAPVLLMSAYEEDHPAVTALLQNGARELLQKPFDAAKAAARIRRMLEGKEQPDGTAGGL